MFCYLKYEGEEQPRITCNIEILKKQDQLEITKMTINKKDRYGQVYKTSELNHLPIQALPTVAEAVATVNEKPFKISGFKQNRRRL